MTSIAELDKRITFQSELRTPDGMGGFSISWRDMATVWAKKTTHRSDEAMQAMAVTGTAIHNFRIRYRTDVRSSWRVKEGNRYYNIIGPPMEKVEGSQRWLDVTVKEAT